MVYNGSGVYIKSGGSTGPTGSGTLNYIAKWTPSGTALGNSQFFDNGTNVGLGTVIPGHYLDILKAQDDITSVNVSNTSTGVSASSRYRLFNGTTSAVFEHYSTLYTTLNYSFQNGTSLVGGGAGGLSIVTSSASGDLRIYVGQATAITARFLASNGFFGVNVSPTAMVHVVGSGATSATFSLKIENSSLANLLSIQNDGKAIFGTALTWDNANKNLNLDTSGSGNDGISCTSTNSNSFLATYNGATAAQAGIYTRAIGAQGYGILSVIEISGGSTYRSSLMVGNRGGTTIGVGAGSGIDFSASTSTAANPTPYGQIGMITTSITNASYAGYLFFSASTGAALTQVVRIDAAGLIVNSGKTLTLGNAAATGLVAGALAATTNASIVITDSTGQAYRIPCII